MKINHPPTEDDTAKPNYEDLWRRLAVGDQELNAELYKEGYLYVKGKLGKSVAIPKVEEVFDGAFDCFQDKILQGKSNPQYAPVAFLKGICGKKCLEFWRKEKREQSFLSRLTRRIKPDTIPDKEKEDELERLFREDSQSECFKHLNEKCQKTLTLKIVDKKTDKEIADILGFQHYGSVKVKRNRCRKKLSDCLKHKMNDGTAKN